MYEIYEIIIFITGTCTSKSQIKPSAIASTKYNKEINIDWKTLNLTKADGDFFLKYKITQYISPAQPAVR